MIIPPHSSLATSHPTSLARFLPARAVKHLRSHRRLARRIALWIGAAAQVLSMTSSALTITAPPSFTPAADAPLAGVLQVNTDIDSRVSISADDGQEVWTHNFYDYDTVHALPLFGFKPGRSYQITVTVYDRNRNEATASDPVAFATDPLPNDFPKLTLFKSVPEKMEPGYSLFMTDVYWEPDGSSRFYAVIVDSAGEVVWYNSPAPGFDIRQLGNSDLFITSNTSFLEMNLLGQTVQTWNAPLLPLNPHDGVPTDHGTILYLNDAVENVDNFPSGTSPNSSTSTASVLYQKVVEISATNSDMLHTWSPIDVLDPTRISYLFTQGSATGTGSGWDTEHSNAVIEDPRDDSLIVSMRNQNAVVKFSRATGQLRWILGPPDGWGPQWQPYLLKPVGTPFAWQYGQHSPILTPQGTLILYDDGNFRASPPNSSLADANNYSRAVEYQINEQTMEVSQVWEYGSTNPGDWLYTGFMGNAEPEPKTGNVFVDFSAVSYADGAHPSASYPNAVMARLKEVTHDASPEVVFDLGVSMFDNANASAQNCSVYRVHRIADLYPHSAISITDLKVTFQDGQPLLQFSGDDAHNYVVEASTNLIDWTSLGTATEYTPHSGEFDLQDAQSDGASPRFYRVLTQ